MALDRHSDCRRQGISLQRHRYFVDFLSAEQVILVDLEALVFLVSQKAGSPLLVKSFDTLAESVDGCASQDCGLGSAFCRYSGLLAVSTVKEFS